MWILISTVAAICQVYRNLSAKRLSCVVCPALNTWARFTFNLPFSLAVIVGMSFCLGSPRLSNSFFLWCLSAALLQIIANILLVVAYRYSSFGEVSVLTRLEAIFGALLGVLFFREAPAAIAWFGLLLSFIGVALMNFSREQEPCNSTSVSYLDRNSLHQKICLISQAFSFGWGSVLAMLTGFCWALSCYLIKQACMLLCLSNNEITYCALTSAFHTLFHMTWMEVFMLTVYLMLLDIRQLKKIATQWKLMLRMGFLSFLTSIMWFWAYNATMVGNARAFASVESLFSVALSHRVLKERGIVQQIPGVIAILIGVVLVIIGS